MPEVLEGFAKGFDGEVVGILRIVGHLQHHEIKRIAVITHQFRIGILLVPFQGGFNQFIVPDRFTGEP